MQGDPMITVYVYILYLIISIGITVWVGRSLHKNGRIFHVENFKGNEDLADSVNHLLLVGFYLINIGFITYTLKGGVKPNDLQAAIEYLSTKVGLVVMILGFMHFFNMYVLVRLRNIALSNFAKA